MATTMIDSRQGMRQENRAYWIIGAIALVALVLLFFAMRSTPTDTMTNTSSVGTTSTMIASPEAGGTFYKNTVNNSTIYNNRAVTSTNDSAIVPNTDYTQPTNAATLPDRSPGAGPEISTTPSGQ